jgi:hypothetical protein
MDTVFQIILDNGELQFEKPRLPNGHVTGAESMSYFATLTSLRPAAWRSEQDFTFTWS